MKYFKLVGEFVLTNGNNTVYRIIQTCEDDEYDLEVDKATLNAKVHAKRMSAKNDIRLEIIELTETEYSTLLPEGEKTDLGNIDEFSFELNFESDKSENEL